ncbi:dethiobiotin synthase [Moritella sp. F3]|uniref:dethiobiotin synthase n=1 Tax=Moritella sp. F3 TaxID=2718882 RepID=UPI001A30D628|nr:dethiobiotin synthase [Moritella sp. F3]GIC77477.1 ATP-dependent dethiobiotin synthetase BioD 1 [Moritella sp. F1]GIC79938.1 ATP-dependent dethiobiotin synthetase BioD 1 [Moritella sp. F3]
MMTTNSKKVFITGTDTDVGKTVVSCAVLDYANKLGLKTVGLKPISAGCELTSVGLRNEDAVLLQQHASQLLDYKIVNPIAYQAPIAPHIAAHNQGESIDLALVNKSLSLVPDDIEITVIEGAGGWHLPISMNRNNTDNSHLFSSWVAENELDVILVVGIKLGCLNHAILSAQAIAHSGANLIGWIANSPTTDIANYDDMIATLKVALAAPLMGEMPYFSSIEDKNKNSANYLDLTSYLSL